MSDMRSRIVKLLKSTKRSGINKLITCMDENGFFMAPCSTDKHLCREGGLAEHSLNVYDAMVSINTGLGAELSEDSIIICAILHDLGKMGDHGKANYVQNILKSGERSAAKPYVTNKDLIYLPHEVRSVMIAERFVTLTEEEETAILWHNGLYGTFKFDIPGKETPIYMVLHFADMWASRVTEKEE